MKVIPRIAPSNGYSLGLALWLPASRPLALLEQAALEQLAQMGDAAVLAGLFALVLAQHQLSPW